MTRPRYGLAVAAVMLAGCAAPASAPRQELYRAMAGDWVGTLEYKDYSDPDRRVTLPTTLTVSYLPDSSAMQLSLVYDDGPGKTVTSRLRLVADLDLTSVDFAEDGDSSAERFTVTSRAGGAADGRTVLVLEREGEDDNAPASIRETLTVGPGELTILKETRPVGGEFGFRNSYRFARP